MSIDTRLGALRLDPPGKVGLVGAGAFGRFCISAYIKSGDFDVVAVADPDPMALAQVRAPRARLEQDWRALLADETIEVVHLATPPHLRGEIVFAALDAGKSVLCEKPLALTLNEADAMIDAAGHARVGLGVNYVMRHLPAYRILEQLAASGLLRRLRSISFQNFAQAPSPEHWFWDREKSGGIFVEHGVHFFDAYGRIAGAAAQVWGGVPRPEAIEATVLYAEDIVGRFYHEFAFPTERTLGTSLFERGYIEIEGWIPTGLTGEVLAEPEDLRLAAREVENLEVTRDDHVMRFHVEFPDREASYETGVVLGMRDVVLNHRNPLHKMTVPVGDARASLALALACQKAAETRRITMV